MTSGTPGGTTSDILIVLIVSVLLSAIDLSAIDRP